MNSKPLGGGGFVVPGSTGGGSGIGGFSQPKTPGTGIGGFSQPKTPTNNFGAGGLVGGGLAGAGAGGLIGSKMNSNPLGGGFTGTNLGNSFTNTQSNLGRNMAGNLGSSGFGSSGFGSSSIGSGSKGSGLMKTAGAGLAGGLVGGALGKSFKKNPFGVKQYSGFSKPKKSFGSHLFGKTGKSFGYKTPG